MKLKLSRLAAAPGVLALGALGLAGCEFSDTFDAGCTTSPEQPGHEVGLVSMTADLPVEVEAGSTFTATINAVGVAPGSSEDPPPADFASLLVFSTEPSRIDIGSVESPAVWPHEVELTVTGQPGEHVLFGVTDAGAVLGTPPDDFVLSCNTAGDDKRGLLATIKIVEPQP